MKDTDKKPPANARRVWRVADLPKQRGEAWYVVTNGTDEPRTVLLSKRRRQVLDLLMQAPVYCASPVRLSDMVYVLKSEAGIDIETEYFPGDTETGAGTYGVYTLRSHVRRLKMQVAA